MADERNQLLSLLTIIIAARCNIRRNMISKVTGLREDPKKAYDALSRFLDGTDNLTPEAAEALIGFLKEQLSKILKPTPVSAVAAEHVVARDLDYLRARVLDEIKLGHKDIIQLEDRRQVDREFLSLLTLDFNPHEQQKVFSYMSGFWFLIRLSTEADGGTGEPRFTISLLNVKQPDYLAIREAKGSERSLSAIPHFSLRWLPYEQGNGRPNEPVFDEKRIHIYRGYVVDTNQPAPVLNFIGGIRDRHPRLHLMTLSVNNTTRATEAQGVTVTSNKQLFFAGPIGACFVPWTTEIESLLAAPNGSLARREDIARSIRERRDELLPHIGRHTERTLLDRLAGFCFPDSLTHVLRDLKQAHQDARDGLLGGHYKVPNQN